MRLATLLVSVLLMAGLTTPASAAEPAAASPPPGWTFTGGQLVWTAPGPIPPGDAAIEFWDGDRLLGLPRPSADLRSYTLDGPGISGVDRLQVRASGRRLDAEEPLRPMNSTPPASAPAPLPAGGIDPGKPGPFQTRTGEYALDPITVPGYPTPIEVQAVVVAPKDLPGKRPLALFPHGRHFTCYDPADPDRILMSRLRRRRERPAGPDVRGRRFRHPDLPGPGHRLR
ncbi:hypothetical protein [Saccharothrix deserti]|uniref:hypothetical protein n=1 Tax=Saccharothrix deserti TaxID=2593674 RepID=UPI00192E416A|nr:hypothetical protein [Saccharothrix deserti]